MIQLSLKQVLDMYDTLMKQVGCFGKLCDKGALCAAIKAPYQTSNGRELNPGVFQKAAVLCRELIKNHPFTDGNKRIATHVMLVFLKLNGTWLSYYQKDLAEMIFAVASGTYGKTEIVEWILDHCVSFRIPPCNDEVEKLKYIDRLLKLLSDHDVHPYNYSIDDDIGFRRFGCPDGWIQIDYDRLKNTWTALTHEIGRDVVYDWSECGTSREACIEFLKLSDNELHLAKYISLFAE